MPELRQWEASQPELPHSLCLSPETLLPQYCCPREAYGTLTVGWRVCGFLQLRVNQDEPVDDEAPRAGTGGAEDGGTEAQSSKDQMRTNVINEILSTERDYIKHLRDICEVRGSPRATGTGWWPAWQGA